jgi:hypothetical protein
MGRFAAVLTSILASLGLAGIVTDDDGDAPTPPADVKTVNVYGSEDGKRVQVRIVQEADAEDDDPANALREAYDAILRLKAERLEDRPKELLDRAAELYRQAVGAYAKDGEAAQREARGLAIAARELARAVERLRDVQRSGRTDPDLPPPPAARRLSATYRVVPTPPAPPLPPPLPTGTGPAPPVPPAPPAPPAPPGANVLELNRLELRSGAGGMTLSGGEGGMASRGVIVVRPGPDGKPQLPEQLKGRVFVTPKGDALKGGQGQSQVQRYELRVEDKDLGTRLREQVDEVRKQAEAAGLKAVEAQANALNRQREAEAIHRQLDEARKATERIFGPGMTGDKAKAFEAARGFAEQLARGMKGDPAAKAREDLQRAYDKIAAARKAAGEDPKGKYYLDAARDLYNAARRDAEAGRHERASELARAAEALTLVPQNLPETTEVRPRYRIERRVIGEPKRDVTVTVPVEVVPRETKPKEAPKAEAEEEDETAIEGIGAALNIEEGKVVVRELVPGGPAAEDGRLKAGDVLVGVAKDGDEKVLFEGKELEAIVENLRGKAGSTVKILVRPKGGEETVTYELKRAKVPVPQRAEPEAKAAEEAPRALPPALPED